MYQELTELDEFAFSNIRQIAVTKKPKVYTFGIVPRAKGSNDLSPDSFKDTALFNRLVRYGELYVPFNFTTIQLCVERTPKKIKSDDKKYVVAFGGQYLQGELEMDISGVTVSRDIRYKPYIVNCPFSIHEAVGYNCNLIYYTIDDNSKYPTRRSIMDYEGIYDGSHWKIVLRLNGEPPVYYDKKGFPKSYKVRKVEEAVEVIREQLSLVHQLMRNAQEEATRSSFK